LVVTVKPGGA
jgi:hypothetical protein